MPSLAALVALISPRDALADEAAAPVDEERLREAGHAVPPKHLPGPVVRRRDR